MATDAERRQLKAEMDFLLEHEELVHYAEIRPMRTVHRSWDAVKAKLRDGLGITMDCSEAVTCLCDWAGLRDPNGLNYNGHGYTGTLLHNLPHYHDPLHARVGALVVFGPNGGDHVCMVYSRGVDPLLWSHGYEGGPILVRLSAERRIHRPPVTFLSIADL